jgi:uncharacterized heparinase superfamily protein
MYEGLGYVITDTRQNLRAARRDLAGELRRCIDNAGTHTTIRLPDELTSLIADLATLDPQAHDMSTAEYAYAVLLAYHQDLTEQRYIRIDADDRQGVTFVIQGVTD